MSAAVAQGAGLDTGHFMGIGHRRACPAARPPAQPAAPAFVLFLAALAVVIGAVMVWVELFVRAAAVYVAVLFLPVGPGQPGLAGHRPLVSAPGGHLGRPRPREVRHRLCAELGCRGPGRRHGIGPGRGRRRTGARGRGRSGGFARRAGRCRAAPPGGLRALGALPPPPFRGGGRRRPPRGARAAGPVRWPTLRPRAGPGGHAASAAAGGGPAAGGRRAAGRPVPGRRRRRRGRSGGGRHRPSGAGGAAVATAPLGRVAGHRVRPARTPGPPRPRPPGSGRRTPRVTAFRTWGIQPRGHRRAGHATTLDGGPDRLGCSPAARTGSRPPAGAGPRPGHARRTGRPRPGCHFEPREPEPPPWLGRGRARINAAASPTGPRRTRPAPRPTRMAEASR